MHRLPDSFLSICDVFLCGVNPSLSILSHLHLSLSAASGFTEPQVSNHKELVPRVVQKLLSHARGLYSASEFGIPVPGHILPALTPYPRYAPLVIVAECSHNPYNMSLQDSCMLRNCDFMNGELKQETKTGFPSFQCLHVSRSGEGFAM